MLSAETASLKAMTEAVKLLAIPPKESSGGLPGKEVPPDYMQATTYREAQLLALKSHNVFLPDNVCDNKLYLEWINHVPSSVRDELVSKHLLA